MGEGLRQEVKSERTEIRSRKEADENFPSLFIHHLSSFPIYDAITESCSLLLTPIQTIRFAYVLLLRFTISYPITTNHHH